MDIAGRILKWLLVAAIVLGVGYFLYTRIPGPIGIASSDTGTSRTAPTPYVVEKIIEKQVAPAAQAPSINQSVVVNVNSAGSSEAQAAEAPKASATAVATAQVQLAAPKNACPPGDGVCWDINPTAKTMIWTGANDGTCDIHQTGQFLTQIRRDGRASFSTTVPGSIRITKGKINGSSFIATEQVIHLDPGTYAVTESTGDSGGFRWTPDKGYGWNR